MTIAFFILIGFAMAVFSLIVGLLVNRIRLKNAEAKLKKYSIELESMVQQRTAQLAESEKKYRSLFEKSKEAVIIIDSGSGEIIDVNDETVAMSGYDHDEILGTKIEKLLDVDESDYNWTRLSEEELVRRDGGRVMVDVVTGHISYDGKDCFQAICRDITAKRELEAQIIHNQKMISLGLMAAGVAHELKNPLGTIYNSCCFIKGEVGENSPKIIKHLGFIENQISICRKIIDDLNITPIEKEISVNLKLMDLNEIIIDYLNILEVSLKPKSITVIKELENLPKIPIDPASFSQVISNLISNAIQAMPSGGTISVKSKYLPHKKPHLTEKEKGLISVQIQDTGMGMDEETMKYIFTPFFSRKSAADGIGLGLWLVHNTVRQYSGTIQVKSKLGQGSTFIIKLPVLNNNG